MPKIRVLIVDDSSLSRRMLTECLSAEPEIEVAGTAADGKIALAKITQVNPDIITLDMEMPVMNGLQTLAAIRKTYPKLPVIMVSKLTERGAAATLDALAAGANDYIHKPDSTGNTAQLVQRFREDLAPKIKALCQRQPEPLIRPVLRTPIESGFASKGGIDVVAIGVSTGGPNALAEMLPGLVANFPVPIVVVQHMPPLFTRLLAERISSLCGLRAREGKAGEMLVPGDLWIAPGGFHMEVERSAEGVKLRLHEEPPENSCRPAVDVLFRSVARVYANRVLAVMLTGMGQDGLIGSRHICEAGGHVIAQDEATSIVWGMPGAVAQAGLAEKILPLGEIAAEVNRRVENGRPRARTLASVSPVIPALRAS